MKTTPLTSTDLARSAIAVPPLARNDDLSLNVAANRALIRHLESGGVRSIMYGGNANFYDLTVSSYAQTVDMLAELAGEDAWIPPRWGPEYARMMDQADLLRQRSFPTAMLLPMSFPFTNDGLATGVRHFTDRLGKPAVIYIKSDNYIKPDTLAKLAEEGRVVAVKYAVVRRDPAQDDYLTQLAQSVDHGLLVSGIGERPAIVHMRDFGLISFTSGSVCIGARGSMKLLKLLQAGRYDEAEQNRAAFMKLEDCRDEISPIRVLHDAVTLAALAEMGSMLPLLTGLEAAEQSRVAPVARALLAQDRSH